MFINNTASQGGGGAIFIEGNATLTDCMFINNTAYDGGAIVIGGGIATLTDCMFMKNTAAVKNSTCSEVWCRRRDVRGRGTLVKLGTLTMSEGAAVVSCRAHITHHVAHAQRIHTSTSRTACISTAQ